MLKTLSRGLVSMVGVMVIMASFCAVVQASDPAVVPEMDAGLVVSAMTMISGGLLVLAGRRRKV